MRTNIIALILSVSTPAVFVTCALADDNWPQAAGPNRNFTITTTNSIPLRWSADRDENIRWRIDLPETGQSGIAVWENRLFFTTMKPLPAESKATKGADIVIYCANADNGKILWQ